MPAPNKIYIQIDLESKDAEKAVDEVNKKIKDFGPTAEKSSQQASGGIKRISTTVEQTAGSMDKLASAIASLGIAEMGKNFFKIGDDLNRVRLGFEHLEGGASLFRQIRDLAIDTGKEFTDLAKAAQDLVAAGTAPGVIAGQLKILVDQASMAGKGMQTVLNITEKMRLVGAKGFISGEDVAVFAQGNVKLMELIKKRLGITQQALQQQMTKLYAPEVMRVALDEMKKLSAGEGAARTADLASDAFGKLTARAQSLAQELVQSLTPSLIEIMKWFEPMVKAVADAVRWFSELPQPVKTAATALFLFAASVQAVSTAVGILKLLPGTIGWIGGLGAAAKNAKPFLEGLKETIGAATYGLGAMEIAAQAVKVGLAGLAQAAPYLVVITSALILAEAAYERYVRRPRAAEQARQNNDALAQHQELLVETLELERKVAQAKIKGIERPTLDIADPSQTSEIVKQNDAIRSYNATMKQALETRNDALMQADEEKMKRARDYGAKLLSDARRDQLKINQETIAALAVAWDEHFKNTKDSVAGTLDALVALEESMTSEVLKQIQIVKDARHKADLDIFMMAQKTATARVEAIPGDPTYAAQRQLAVRQFANQDNAIEQARTENVRKYNEEIDKQLRGVDDVYQKEIENLYQLRKEKKISDQQEREAGLRAADVATKAYANLEEERRKFRTVQNDLADAQIAQARIEMEKSVNAAIFNLEKDQREALAQMRLDEINNTRDYAIAAATAVDAQTKEQRLAQIETVKNAQLVALAAVRDEEKKNLDLAREQLRVTLQTAVDIKTISPGEMKERLDEYDRNMRRQLDAIGEKYQHDTQMTRIESWRAGNQVILEEQRQVYETIAGFMGELFDSFLDKNKSVWSAVGDLIKKTILGAFKTVITSRLAAAFTGMLGYGPVSVTTGALGQQIPVFGGGGSAPTPYYGGTAEGGGSASRSILDAATSAIVREVQTAPRTTSGGGGMQSADRMMNDADAPIDVVSTTSGGGVVSGGGSKFSLQFGKIRESFNIGKSVMIGGELKPWAQLTGRQRLASIVQSEGFATLASSVGLPMFMGSLQKKGVAAGIAGIAGGALAGYGLAQMFGAYGPSGLLAGAGLGLFAAGYKRRGVSGLAMTTLGGTLAGAGIGNMIMPGVGAVVGAAVGAAVGLGVGIVNLFRKSKEQQVRSQIQQTYGIDIRDNNILTQIAEIATQRFGGDVRMAVHSQEVQEMVRLYSLMTNQTAMLPREMYSATYAQSAAGGLQLQPVYSGGRLVSSPYQGTTTTQFQNALASQPPVFIQLNPAQAASMFSGQVIQVLGENPGAVGQANTSAARSGQGRQAQSGALLEPSTVLV